MSINGAQHIGPGNPELEMELTSGGDNGLTRQEFIGQMAKVVVGGLVSVGTAGFTGKLLADAGRPSISADSVDEAQTGSPTETGCDTDREIIAVGRLQVGAESVIRTGDVTFPHVLTSLVVDPSHKGRTATMSVGFLNNATQSIHPDNNARLTSYVDGDNLDTVELANFENGEPVSPSKKEIILGDTVALTLESLGTNDVTSGGWFVDLYYEKECEPSPTTTTNPSQTTTTQPPTRVSTTVPAPTTTPERPD